jgi:Rps23 Pro-64 3,4-dihydroxylase Tpa1-like proline 4-hydroxylase
MLAEKLFYIDPEYLDELATKNKEKYASAVPFPHIVIDNFLPDTQILDRVLEEFPDPNAIEWQHFENKSEKKLASTSELQMGELTRILLYQLNSSTFLNFLEKLTGIEGIIPDPHFVGGGLHQIEKGGYLKVHADFNRYERLKLDRRLNLLLYLNKDWQEEYGGHLQLWDADMKECHKKVLPIFNRCVIFSTTDFSYHGHPDPLTCPEGGSRKSLALYYYTNGRPAEEVSKGHTTIFKAREGEEIEPETKSERFIKKFIPPILLDVKNALMKK